MAYDSNLAARIRDLLPAAPDLSERKMFGGLCFMYHGHMLCGVIKNDLMARVGPEQYAHCLTLPGAREMDFTGKPLKGMVYVAEDAVQDDEVLFDWIQYALNFNETLEPKTA